MNTLTQKSCYVLFLLASELSQLKRVRHCNLEVLGRVAIRLGDLADETIDSFAAANLRALASGLSDVKTEEDVTIFVTVYKLPLKYLIINSDSNVRKQITSCFHPPSQEIPGYVRGRMRRRVAIDLRRIDS